MVSKGVASTIRFLTGMSCQYVDASVFEGPKVYFCNHASHLDLPAVWAALPNLQRKKVRPVAALDYWGKTKFRRYVAKNIFNALLVERKKVQRSNNPITAMEQALDGSGSLIIFPEGTRSSHGELQKFKNGLYHLAKQRPDTEFVPVLLENFNRMLPKGEWVPVPVICRVSFGHTLQLKPDEARDEFTARLENEIKEMMPNDL